VAIPADRNVVQKEAEKRLKYESLCTEIQVNVECEMYDHTINSWCTRIVTKGLKKNLEAMPRKISIDSHGTSHKCGKYCNMKLEP
jgi:hypothetical protein